jgi:hypothetical protein
MTPLELISDAKLHHHRAIRNETAASARPLQLIANLG